MKYYQEILQKHLERRQKKNVAYSLRAFAKSVNLTSAHLSMVLSSKRKLSPTTATRIANILELDEDEKEMFILSAQLDQAKNQDLKLQLEQKIQRLKGKDNFVKMSADEIEVFTQWPFPVLLNLFDLNSFRPDRAWIAKMLGVTIEESENLLKKLESLDILSRHKVWKINKNKIKTPVIPSAAIRSFHKTALSKATDAIEEQNINERDFSSMIMTIDETHVEEAKARITEFRRRFFQDFGSSKNKNGVYCLSIQLFSTLSKTKPVGNL